MVYIHRTQITFTEHKSSALNYSTMAVAIQLDLSYVVGLSYVAVMSGLDLNASPAYIV